jgi:putative ubiquitin-RnfH superfamily antitoxin RatB of RatAB toxin-antitoxin module
MIFGNMNIKSLRTRIDNLDLKVFYGYIYIVQIIKIQLNTYHTVVTTIRLSELNDRCDEKACGNHDELD